MTWQVFLRRGRWSAQVAEALRTARAAHHLIELDAPLADAVGDALDNGFRRLAIGGGDAEAAVAVGEVLARRLGGDADLAIIPDRPSDLLRTFAADQTVAGGVARIVHHVPYPIDVGVAEGSFGRVAFVNSIASGLLAGGPGWFPWWPVPLRMGGRVSIIAGSDVDDSVGSGLLVLNGQFWGDWSVAPRSTLIDGVMDVQVFTGRRMVLARLRPPMRRGLHVRSHHVRRHSLSKAAISIPDPWEVSIDGIRRGRGGFEITTFPTAIRLAI